MNLSTCCVLLGAKHAKATCLSAHQQMTGFRRRGVCVYNGTLLGLKKNEAVPFAATWMDLLIVKSVRPDRYHDVTYVWNLKDNTEEFIYETETDSQT